MTWLDFVAAVRVDLPVDGDRINVATGVTNYLDRQILYAAIQIQQLIPFYQVGHHTTYGPNDLIQEGMASIGVIPQGQQCRPLDAYYRMTGAQCVSQPLQPYPWGNRHDLICGNPRIINTQFLMAIDPWGLQFTVFPAVGCYHHIDLTWNGVKTSFVNADETPFDMDVVEAVGLFVKAKISRLVDHDLQENNSYMAEYLRRRSLLYADSIERTKLSVTADSPNPSANCANSYSTCVSSCCGGGTVANEDTTEFCAFGDSGETATILNTSAVANLVHSLEPDFVMHMGDCNLPAGDPVTLQDNFLKYHGIYVPAAFYLAWGERDILTDSGAALTALLSLQAAANSGLTYYDFINGKCHLFVLDTNGDPVAQAAWLQPLVQASTLWNVVVLHDSPYTSDVNRAPGNLNWRLPFENWGVNLVISASGQNYERLYENGLIYLNCGLGGETKTGFVSPATNGSQFRYNSFYGSLYITATDQRLQASFYNTKGEVIDSIAFEDCLADSGSCSTSGSATTCTPCPACPPVPVPNPGTWCQLRGAPAPEGVVVADLNCWYRRDNGIDYEFWFHESGGGTAFGWILVTKLA